MMRLQWLFFALPLLAADGDALFKKNCSIGYCHGTAGAASRGPRLRDREFDGPYVYRVTRDGIPNSAMPGWKDKLSDEEIRAIVVYVMSLSGKPANLPPPDKKEEAASPSVFLEQCGSCHQAGGQGKAVGPPLNGYTEARIREALAKAPKQIRQIVMSDGETFPAMVALTEADFVTAYDLTEPPPVKRSLERKDIRSMSPNSTWTHPSVKTLPPSLLDFLRTAR
jgi:mono/diheme cytochrome c family protein